MNIVGHAVVTKENETRKLWMWGNNNWSCTGGFASEVPKEVSIEGIDLKNLYIFISGQMSILAQEDNSMFLAGNISNSGSTIVVNGVNKPLASYTKFSIKDYLSIDENVSFKKIVRNEVLGNNLYQMSDYSIYGLGNQSLLGLGTTNTEYLTKPQKINTPEKFIDIVGGKNFYIAITEDGKVYGTGSNSNGVLGRWMGIDRKQPNSRYKTAFDWVECPELEI